MSSFARSVAVLFAIGMVGGYGGLYLVAAADGGGAPLVDAQGRIPDPPPLPCKLQSWPNADRKCLEWTAPRPEVAALATDRAQAAASSPPVSEKRTIDVAHEIAPNGVGLGNRQTIDVAPAVPEAARNVAATPVPQADPRAAASAKTPASKSRVASRSGSKALSAVRSFDDNLSDVPVSGYSADGMPHKVVIRPTSIQDSYYYDARSRR